MKRLCALVAITFLSCPAAWAQLTHYYETTQKDTGAMIDKSFIRFDTNADGNKTVHFEEGFPHYTKIETYTFSPQYDTLGAHIVDETTQTDYTMERRGTSAVISGKLYGKAVDRTIELGSDPLYLFPKFNMAGFVLSDEKKTAFWSLRNDTLEEFKMIATRDGVENIIIQGEFTYAAKIYLTTANPLFRVFKRTYFFRLNDGLFLKQEYADGRVRELVKEE